MSRFLFSLAALAALAYLAACAALFVFQRSLIYFPQPRQLAGGVPVLALPTPQGADALIYLGGNAEDVSASLPGLSAAFPGHALFLLHYRGYGASALAAAGQI